MIDAFHRAALAAALLAGCIAAASAQTAPSAVTIVAPPEGSYVTGPIILQAHVIDAPQVRQLTFFADGRSVCTLVRAPFECSWDAGIGIREHVIRVVATMNDGARVVVTTRTKNAGYTESVDVEVVQVTATVTDSQNKFVHGLPREIFRREGRQRGAAADRVRRREHPARAGRGRRRQRQHDQRDADAEGRGEDVPERTAADRPGDADGLQRQHLHPGAPLDGPGRAAEGGRSADALGRDGALRRDAHRAQHRRQAAGPAGHWSSSPTARTRTVSRR